MFIFFFSSFILNLFISFFTFLSVFLELYLAHFPFDCFHLFILFCLRFFFSYIFLCLFSSKSLLLAIACAGLCLLVKFFFFFFVACWKPFAITLILYQTFLSLSLSFLFLFNNPYGIAGAHQLNVCYSFVRHWPTDLFAFTKCLAQFWIQFQQNNWSMNEQINKFSKALDAKWNSLLLLYLDELLQLRNIPSHSALSYPSYYKILLLSISFGFFVFFFSFQQFKFFIFQMGLFSLNFFSLSVYVRLSAKINNLIFVSGDQNLLLDSHKHWINLALFNGNILQNILPLKKLAWNTLSASDKICSFFHSMLTKLIHLNVCVCIYNGISLFGKSSRNQDA